MSAKIEKYEEAEQPLAVLGYELSIEQLVARVEKVREVARRLMNDGEHFGVIPGTQKPTLMKPGAELLALTFRLAPSFFVERIDLGDGHREYQVKCTLIHIPTSQVIAEGLGSCSTLESKYRYRDAKRSCPACGKQAIIKGREEFGGGWLCHAKQGGCGKKFPDGTEAIERQTVGRVENPDLADVYNTVLKMAKKRAQIDATLTATAASDIFTQDLEEAEEKLSQEEKPKKNGHSAREAYLAFAAEAEELGLEVPTFGDLAELTEAQIIAAGGELKKSIEKHWIETLATAERLGLKIPVLPPFGVLANVQARIAIARELLPRIEAAQAIRIEQEQAEMIGDAERDQAEQRRMSRSRR